MNNKQIEALKLYKYYIQNPNVDIVHYNNIAHVIICHKNGKVVKSSNIIVDNEDLKFIKIISPYAMCEVALRKFKDAQLFEVVAFEKRKGYGTALMNVLYSFCSSINGNMKISWDSTKEGCYLYNSLPFVRKIQEKNGPFSYGVYEINC